MKKDNAMWYVAGLTLSLTGGLAYLAYKKRNRSTQSKGDIIRTLLMGQSWYISKMKNTGGMGTKLKSVWTLFDNGMLLDLGHKDTYSPDQKRYDNIGAWTLYGRELEVKWQGPNDYMAYQWEVEVLQANKIRLHNLTSSAVVELTALKNQ